jgi:hypothetical protein
MQQNLSPNDHRIRLKKMTEYGNSLSSPIIPVHHHRSATVAAEDDSAAADELSVAAEDVSAATEELSVAAEDDSAADEVSVAAEDGSAAADELSVAAEDVSAATEELSVVTVLSHESESESSDEAESESGFWSDSLLSTFPLWILEKYLRNHFKIITGFAWMTAWLISSARPIIVSKSGRDLIVIFGAGSQNVSWLKDWILVWYLAIGHWLL